MRAGGLARELGGDLPCVRCKYNLKGLSIRGACPECGTPIRATLLAAVDPRASELRPVQRPRLVATGLLLWSGGAFVGALLAWVVRIADVVLELRGVRADAAWGAVGCVVASGVGAVALISPQIGVPVRSRLLVVLALLFYVPLAYATWRLLLLHDPANPAPYFAEGHLSGTRLVYQAAAMLSVVGIALALRPVGRLLTARSMVLRTGMVDRQTLAGIAGAAGLCVLGDGVLFAVSSEPSALMDALRIGGTVLVVCGSVLLTIGLLGVLIDSWRIRGVILQPAFTLEQLLAGGEGESEKPSPGLRAGGGE